MVRLPRKDDVRKNGSKNERSMSNRDYAYSPIQSFTYDEARNAVGNSNDLFKLWNTEFNALSTANNYSDFVSSMNEGTDGWYSTIANGIPFVKDLHNSMLGRDSAKDYLDNNGMSWKDMQGYNDLKLLSRASSGAGSLTQSGLSYLSNIGNDLGKLYSGQPQKLNSVGTHVIKW